MAEMILCFIGGLAIGHIVTVSMMHKMTDEGMEVLERAKRCQQDAQALWDKIKRAQTR